MKTPQIIYIVISSIGLLFTAYNHGKPRDNYSIWSTLVSTAIGIGLLIWGGFFNQ